MEGQLCESTLLTSSSIFYEWNSQNLINYKYGWQLKIEKVHMNVNACAPEDCCHG